MSYLLTVSVQDTHRAASFVNVVTKKEPHVWLKDITEAIKKTEVRDRKMGTVLYSGVEGKRFKIIYHSMVKYVTLLNWCKVPDTYKLDNEFTQTSKSYR